MSGSRKILIVEDSDDDFDACVSALSQNGNVPDLIDRCETGNEAIDYLFGAHHHNEFQKRPLPGLVLLDLNLPGVSGREVLARIKSNPTLKQIPVVILSTSSYVEDIEECYRIGANSFIEKPLSLDGYIKKIQLVYEYWFELAHMPRATC